MIRTKPAPKPENPVMIDRVIASIQEELIAKIGWLDHAFGRSQKLVTRQNKKDYYYPAVYIGGNEYLNVLPGQDLGNRSFFVVGDPHTIDNFKPRNYNTISSPVAVVFWYDLTSIYPKAKERNTEEIKRQILRVLTEMVLPEGSRLTLQKIYEQAENIYKEYSIREIDTQYLMQPFAGIRIEGVLTYKEECLK